MEFSQAKPNPSLAASLTLVLILALTQTRIRHQNRYNNTCERLMREHPCNDIELLRHLVNAATFARAVYGYPMLRGI